MFLAKKNQSRKSKPKIKAENQSRKSKPKSFFSENKLFDPWVETSFAKLVFGRKTIFQQCIKNFFLEKMPIINCLC